MAVRSLARSGIGTGGKYISFLAGNTAFSPDSDELIEEQVLASDTATVTFTSIPQTYKHLQLRFVARSTYAGDNASLLIRLNSDTGSNYAYHRMYGTAGSVNATSSTSASGMIVAAAPGGTSAASNFSGGIIDIADYTSTAKNTTIKSFDGKYNENPYVGLESGLWLNTAAVTSVTFYTTNNLKAGSRFSLYGSNG